ncbi:hypothetical protein [Sporichthya sp.]|uniref:hypothetical protein n=1 Tax=Sporichthya sp. TaxID=65475 RepID=UPI0017FBE9E8|nr:hypothetical protein [Sporichthya sp.]MBA3744479.1 hypothetical protein [Sporichthya sp.]
MTKSDALAALVDEFFAPSFDDPAEGATLWAFLAGGVDRALVDRHPGQLGLELLALAPRRRRVVLGVGAVERDAGGAVLGTGHRGAHAVRHRARRARLGRHGLGRGPLRRAVPVDGSGVAGGRLLGHEVDRSEVDHHAPGLGHSFGAFARRAAGLPGHRSTQTPMSPPHLRYRARNARIVGKARFVKIL